MLPINQTLTSTDNHLHIPIAARVGADRTQIVHHSIDVNFTSERNRVVAMYKLCIRDCHVTDEYVRNACVENQVAKVDGYGGRIREGQVANYIAPI